MSNCNSLGTESESDSDLSFDSESDVDDDYSPNEEINSYSIDVPVGFDNSNLVNDNNNSPSSSHNNGSNDANGD